MQPLMCSLPLLHKLPPVPHYLLDLTGFPVGGEAEERFQGIPMKSSVAVFYSSLRILTQEKPVSRVSWGNDPIAKSWQRVMSSVLALPHPSYSAQAPGNNSPRESFPLRFWNCMGQIPWAFQAPWQLMERAEKGRDEIRVGGTTHKISFLKTC